MKPIVTPSSKILNDLSRPHWFPILEKIKCSDGLSVAELAEEMGMSYMGIKKHCQAMHKLGWLETWRTPSTSGRPQKLYRLTDKTESIFSQIGNATCLAILDAATQLEAHGAEKLLLAFFRNQTERLVQIIGGDSVQERAERLSAERSAQGYYSTCSVIGEESMRIEEWHNPLQPLFDRYETLSRMEVQMFEKLLGARVERTVTQTAHHTRYQFDISPR